MLTQSENVLKMQSKNVRFSIEENQEDKNERRGIFSDKERRKNISNYQ